jgi:hypothetical protein
VSGPSGSGRSEIARLYARSVSELGLVPVGQLVSKRLWRDFWPTWPGQSLALVRTAFRDAGGGTLRIDADGSWPGRDTDGAAEVLHALDRVMSEPEEARTVVAVTGAPEAVEELLAGVPALGPALRVQTAPCSADELAQAAATLLGRYGHEVPDDVVEALELAISRTGLTSIWSAHELARRVGRTAASQTLTAADVRATTADADRRGLTAVM